MPLSSSAKSQLYALAIRNLCKMVKLVLSFYSRLCKGSILLRFRLRACPALPPLLTVVSAIRDEVVDLPGGRVVCLEAS